MRIKLQIRKLEPSITGRPRWEVTGGGYGEAVVAQNPEGLQCLTCWSLDCVHVQAVQKYGH